ncbi:MAG: HAMP domain-containing protein [Acidobacteriia bacterium]|nr:HAMP domain-containing protein [Terriglobia bacterium]
MDERDKSRRKAILVVLLVLVPVLFFLGWSQASLNLSFIRPSNAQQTILLMAVSTVIFLAFVIFALILARILLKVYVERRQQQLGARFKTKMVVAFLVLSLVPVCFLFIFAYGLINRSIDKWFGIPFDIVRQDASEIFRQVELQAEQHTLHDTFHLASDERLEREIARRDFAALAQVLAQHAQMLNLQSAAFLDAHGHVLAGVGEASADEAQFLKLFPGLRAGRLPAEGAAARWRSGNTDLFLAAYPVFGPRGERLGAVVSARHLPTNVKQMADEIQREAHKYDELSHERKAVKRNYLSMLWLLTLIILFAATWFALFLAKQVTVPIQALVEATHEISGGNLSHRVAARADDELGKLILSFNEMTRQLEENRYALEQAALDLQKANRELEERTHTTEAILANIPTGVISLDRQGQVTQVNATVERMLGTERVKSARTLADVFSAEDFREISRLLRRATRQGVITRQIELEMGGRRVSIALTISSVRAPHGPVGTLLVLEDLSELLRAQRATAWQEVAQRIAHEIKNPLTPIQLSTDRIRRLIERAAPNAVSEDLVNAVGDSAALVSREVETLKHLVDEFATLARFPASRPEPSALNPIVEKALDIFDGRLDGITLYRDLAPDLPLVQADGEQLKRAVVNLIDNAAEALERSALKEIRVRTGHDTERDVVELVVADSGPGIPPEAKERLFLPFFSTKRRGTGLGLAIVSRIVSEHNGTIRVEENSPSGTRFVIELPVDRATAIAEL